MGGNGCNRRQDFYRARPQAVRCKLLVRGQPSAGRMFRLEAPSCEAFPLFLPLPVHPN